MTLTAFSFFDPRPRQSHLAGTIAGIMEQTGNSHLLFSRLPMQRTAGF